MRWTGPALVCTAFLVSCGESLTVNPNDAPDGGAAVADGAAASDGGVVLAPLACGGPKDVFCTNFEEASPLLKWVDLGGPTIVDSLSVSPTHSILMTANESQVVTINQNFEKSLFGAAKKIFDVDIAFSLEASSDGLAARIVTLVLSKTGTGAGQVGEAVYRIVATKKPGAFALKLFDRNTEVGALKDAPIAAWTKLRITAKDENGGGNWEVVADYLGAQVVSTLKDPASISTTHVNLELGADRGGVAGVGGAFVAHYDDVRVRNLN